MAMGVPTERPAKSNASFWLLFAIFALVALILLLVAFALAAWFCIDQSYLSASLVPKARGGMRWRAVTTTDAVLGGTSTIRILDPGRLSFRFDFRLTRASTKPYVAAEMMFEDRQGNAVPADLSRYTTVTFVANSWVYPVGKYRYNRVFFSNDVSRSPRRH